MEKIDWSKAPEGATHYWPGNSRFYEKVGESYFVSGQQNFGPVNSPESWVEKLVARPSTAWSGEGLPPVGTVCELHIKDDRWETCEVIAHDQQDGERVAVVRYGAGYYGGDTECLRPIRTPEQIAADERDAAINEIGNLIASVGPTFRDQATRLYDAGYRKQEQPK